MARTLSFFVVLVASSSLLADTKKGIEGYWSGTLKVGAMELRVAFKIKTTDGKLTATMDSIDQGAKDIAIEKVEFADGKLTLAMPKFKSSYIGTLQADGDAIKGELDQGVKLPLELKRSDKAVTLNRPQHPIKPYPYVEEEVAFSSKVKDVTLAGTFTKPHGEGRFPTVVLISGSGPQDRDESLLGHKPFLVLADHLTRNGIAVLRFDDRGFGKSTGDFEKATSRDFADDVAGAVAFLKGRRDVGKIGLMGHSEGGLIAPMVAAGDRQIAFMVLLAGPGVPGDEILVAQGQLILKGMGASEKDLARQKQMLSRLMNLAKEGSDAAKLKAAVNELEKQLSDEEKKELQKAKGAVEAQLSRLATPWFRYFLTYDPRPTLAIVRCPVLAINGELDLQVPCKENLAEIEKALRAGGNREVTTKELAGLNHLFQKTKTGLPSEYGKIEETFSPDALKLISEWINRRN